MEREIICRDITLEDRMTVARLHFEEIVKGKKAPVRFVRDFVLDDYKVRGKLPEKYSKDGKLIHQNPVFLSGHLRGPVVSKICNELTCELYPGRDPKTYLAAVNSYATLSGKFLNDRLGDIDAHVKVLRDAVAAIENAYKADTFSHTSMDFYYTTKKMLAGFGRGEGDNESDTDEAEE